MKKLKGQKNKLTKAQAMAFRKRWDMVNAFQMSEVRALSANEKLGQLATLMALAKELGWIGALEKEAGEVRARWNKLRKAYHA